MFKKTIILGVTLAVVSLPSWASGFYVGAGVGRDATNFSTAITNAATINILGVGNTYSQRATADDGASGWLGSIFAGYRWDINHTFSLASELNVDGSSAEHTDAVADSNGVIFAKNKYSSDRSFGLSVLPGFKIADNTRIYGRVGYVRANFNVDTLLPDVDGTLVANSDSKALNGLRYGLGVETEIAKNTGLRLDYSHINYQTYDKTSVSQSWPLTIVNDVKVSPNADQIVLGVDYYFG